MTNTWKMSRVQVSGGHRTLSIWIWPLWRVKSCFMSAAQFVDSIVSLVFQTKPPPSSCRLLWWQMWANQRTAASTPPGCWCWWAPEHLGQVEFKAGPGIGQFDSTGSCERNRQGSEQLAWHSLVQNGCILLSQLGRYRHRINCVWNIVRSTPLSQIDCCVKIYENMYLGFWLETKSPHSHCSTHSHHY